MIFYSESSKKTIEDIDSFIERMVFVQQNAKKVHAATATLTIAPVACEFPVGTRCILLYYGDQKKNPDNDRLWTSGYVGVGRLFNKKQKPIYTDGKENIVVIMPQYDVDPWKMLEVVLSDDEYDDYLAELPENEFLCKVFYEQPLIRLAQDARNDGDLLYAISYINACYSLCKKGLKKDLGNL